MVAVTYRHNLNIEYRILYMVWDIEHRTIGMCFFFGLCAEGEGKASSYHL